jgi:hypothetical protein
LFQNQVEIIEMGKPVGQIQEAIQRDIQKNGKEIDFLSNLISEIFAYRISGDKDGGEDLKKLEWIEKGLAKAGIIAAEGNLIPIRTSVISQPAVKMGVGDDEEPMSATRIRNIIYDMDPSTSMSDRIRLFKEQTNNFYVTESRDYTPEIAAAIYQHNPARTDAKMEVISVAVKEAPTKAKAKASATSAAKTQKRKGTEGTEGTEGTKSKKGGSRKGPKHRKTKRRRTRKTKRRRSQRN